MGEEWKIEIINEEGRSILYNSIVLVPLRNIEHLAHECK
jgi:hypothetical protein